MEDRTLRTVWENLCLVTILTVSALNGFTLGEQSHLALYQIGFTLKTKLQTEKCCRGWQTRLFPLNNCNISILVDWASQVALVVKNPSANAGDARATVQSLGWEDPLEKEMAPHSSMLAWRIPWTKEPGGLQSVGPQSQTRLTMHTHILLDQLKCYLKKIMAMGWEQGRGVLRKPRASVSHLLQLGPVEPKPTGSCPNSL